MSDEPTLAGFDVLIVGSGPVGAAFARTISENAPRARILMVEVGPQLSPRPGTHVKNIADLEERTRAQIRSQGPFQYSYAEAAKAASEDDESHLDFRQRAGFMARPGTYIAEALDGPDGTNRLPAAAHSSNVGGMGAHWTAACPQPGNSERIPFISDDEWARITDKATELLQVTTDVYEETPETMLVRRALGRAFDPLLPADRKVQFFPTAAQWKDGRYQWSGPAVVLGPLCERANDGSGHFTLRSETICRRILVEDGRAVGAEVEHLPTGKRETLRATVVVVAADSLRTPQLLWASNIRDVALGHYLNDQPQSVSALEIQFDPAELEEARASLAAEGRWPPKREVTPDSIPNSFWVPFHDPTHPFLGQVLYGKITEGPPGAPPTDLVIFSWFTSKEIRFEDHVEFSETEVDSYGMPKMIFHHELTPKDQETIARSVEDQRLAAKALGKVLAEGETKILPAGSSLHYQGTVRMGERDDGTSVCDSYSEVWSVKNLFVGGNGVIPTSTASNPTYSAVALAVRAGEKIAARFGADFKRG